MPTFCRFFTLRLKPLCLKVMAKVTVRTMVLTTLLLGGLSGHVSADSASNIPSNNASNIPSNDTSDDNWFGDNWQFNGFGTLSYTRTDKYKDRIPRRNMNQSGIDLEKNGFLMDSRFGLQIKGQLNDHWSVVGQIVAREQLANHLEDHIDLAFARYQASNEWQIAIGRQAFDLFFLSDHRNTAYSYDWVRPPTEFYGFMPYDSFDGVKLIRDWGDFDNAWHWDVSVGNIKAKFDLDVLTKSSDVDSTKAEPIYGSALSWQGSQWRVRANVAILKFEQELDDRDELNFLAEHIGPIWPEFRRVARDIEGNSTLRYASLGASWTSGDWKVQSEWNIIDADFITVNGQRGYVHVARRWQAWQPFVTFGFAHDNQRVDYKPPPRGAGLEFILDDVTHTVQNMRHNQHSFSLGVRWDFTPQKALKLQCDRFYFQADSGSIHGRIDLRYTKDETRSWCTASYDWVF